MITAYFDVDKTEPAHCAIDFMNAFIPHYIKRDEPYGKYAAQTVNYKRIKDVNGKGYWVWLTKISDALNASGYRNLVEDDGRTFHEINEEKQITADDGKHNEPRIVFTRLTKKQEYRFMGIFMVDTKRSYPGHIYHIRVAKRADFTVDPPIIYYEDSQKGSTNINTAVKPLNITVINGIIKVTCSNCSYVFTKARRCPECGQLQKY